MPTLDEIEQMTKGREELENIARQKNIATEEMGREVKRMERMRRDFEEARNKQDAFLKKKEEELETKIAFLEQTIQNEMKALALLQLEGRNVFTLLTEKTEGLMEKATSLIGKAGNLVEQAGKFKFIGEELIRQAQERIAKVDDKTIAQSKIEQTLKAKEEQIDKKARMAETKLQKAKQLAYWHKKPGAVYHTKEQ